MSNYDKSNSPGEMEQHSRQWLRERDWLLPPVSRAAGTLWYGGREIRLSQLSDLLTLLLVPASSAWQDLTRQTTSMPSPMELLDPQPQNPPAFQPPLWLAPPLTPNYTLPLLPHFNPQNVISYPELRTCYNAFTHYLMLMSKIIEYVFSLFLS